jgi:hypothetical protein
VTAVWNIPIKGMVSMRIRGVEMSVRSKPKGLNPGQTRVEQGEPQIDQTFRVCPEKKGHGTEYLLVK